MTQHDLLINRYNQITSTHIQANGCSVATPVYLAPTSDQSKALLNGFREVVRRQRMEMGWNDTTTSNIGVTVTTATAPPMTPAEEELGMTEEALRYALFQRRGTPDKLIFKLQKLTGIELVTREAIVSTLCAWLDANDLTDENKRPKTTNKTSKSTTKRAKPTSPVSQ